MTSLIPQTERSSTAEWPAWPMTLEVRWILWGSVPPAMIERLGPFGEDIERREDRYLVDPFQAQLGVKIRGGVQLDLKAYRGSPGDLLITDHAAGRMELWQKWAVPYDPDREPPAEASGWVAVGKVRRRRSFQVEPGRILERPLDEAATSPGCTMELTEVAVGADTWWTLAFEAAGPIEVLEQNLRATTEDLLLDSLPGRLHLGLVDSMSYVQWLGDLGLGRGAEPGGVRPMG